MIVVSDTSPINYLILVEAIHVLPVLFGRVVVPPQVVAELRHTDSPKMVQDWALSPQSWFEIVAPIELQKGMDLDEGETAAISLAIQLAADQLLVDDLRARLVAKNRQIEVTGTIGVLISAANRGLIDLAQTITRLQQTSFRLAPHIWQVLLEKS
jgi:predicted nucleic acid-binding protein